MSPDRLRSRLWSPEVRHAATSPSGILAAGAGAAVGVLATVASAGVALPVLGAVAGGLVGCGARAAFAVPRRAPGAKGRPRDVFAIAEPWRHQVIDALKAQTRFAEAVDTFPDGPLRRSVSVVGDRLDEAVEECWKVATQGHRVAEGRRRVNDTQIRTELNRLQAQLPADGPPSPTQQRTLDSLTAQLDAAQRMDALMAQTEAELSLLNAQLDEAVTQAIELSVTNQADGLEPMGADVAAIVDNLTTLRHAMGDLGGPTAGGTGTTSPPAAP